MPLFYRQFYRPSVLRSFAMTPIIVLLVGCSSPTKYEPRDDFSQKVSKAEVLEKSESSSKSCQSPYVVKSGDTLSGISFKCDIKMSAIADLNHLLPPYIIYVKQELVLPINQEQAAVSFPEIKPSIKDPIETQHKIIKEDGVSSDSKSTIKPILKVIKTKPEASDVTATALDNSPASKVKNTKTKNNKWQWPMHKGLSYRYIRDSAGLSVLEVYGVPGQDVKAVAPGKVVYAGNGIINYGWMLVIKHNNDYMSIYAHNSALLVKEGDEVNAGDVVASMGATGNTSRPKLYVEARFQGRKTDIKKVLKP